MTYLKSAGPKPDSCVFCEALAENDDAKNLIVHRGQHCFVILNLFPYSNGHLMVVPFAHVDSVEGMTLESLSEMMALSQHGLGVLRAAYSPQAFNLGINIGGPAGAGVPGHVHLHLVPRWGGDTNFMSVLANTRVIPEALSQTYERLCALWLQE